MKKTKRIAALIVSIFTVAAIAFFLEREISRDGLTSAFTYLIGQ